MADLERLLCGGFPVEEAVTLEQLEEAVDSPDGWQQYLFPVDRVLMETRISFYRGLKNQATVAVREQAVSSGEAWTEKRRRCRSP